MNIESSQTNRRKKVLIFGDWVVDDYWVMGLHRSPTASRTGQAHHRSLHPLQGSVRALCGAGRTASVLFEAEFPNSERFEIVGVGMWHLKDDLAISQLINSRKLIGQNPYQLTIDIPGEQFCNVVNLAPQLSSFLNTEVAKNLPYYSDYQGVGTTRMIRIFQNTGTQIELLERIDWELQAPFNQVEEVHAWFPEPDLYANDPTNRSYREAADSLWTKLPSLPFEDIQAVVIKDLGKGCVSSATVRWIKDQVPKKIPWFISSKSWRPAWFRQIPNDSLALLMVPQVAARTAIQSGAVRHWLTKSGVPTRDMIACIDDLYHEYSLEDQTIVVVLPNKQQALIRGPSGKYDCHVQRLEAPVDLDFEVAMASVLLPAIVAHLLQMSNADLSDANIVAEHIQASASFTDEWMKREVERIAAAEDLNPPKQLTLNLGNSYTKSGEWQPLKWETERHRWQMAFNSRKMGIVEVNDVPSIELSRAMTVLDGYVCLVGHKQDVVQRLIREVRRFVWTRKRRHVSFLLTASPGSGKSALIDSLVKAESLASYTINIAQLAERLGLIDEFDTVSTLQAQNRSAPLLVFVDEINSKLDSQHVYDLFLSVMQNGEYVRGGNRFRLDPCIWIFVGTAKPTEDNDDPATKAKDFESRLTVAPLSLDPPDLGITALERPNIDAEIRLERVYLGVAILTAQFPDVRRVTRKVLRLFHLLPDKCTVRDLVKLISGFDNVQLGKVHSGNVPEASFSQIESLGSFDFSIWNQSGEDGFVKIVPR